MLSVLHVWRAVLGTVLVVATGKAADRMHREEETGLGGIT